MPKVNVYLPDELAASVKSAGVPVSAVCQRALADAVAASSGLAPAAAGADGPADLGRFTQRARDVVAFARDQSSSPTSVDVLAGIVDEGANLALVVLTTLDVEPADLLEEAVASTGHEPAAVSAVVQAAEDASALCGHSYVGTEHVLIGLAAGPRTDPVVAAMQTLGLDKASLLIAVKSSLAAMNYMRTSLPLAALSAPVQSILEEIRQRLSRLDRSSTT